jgi:uncharacterized protein YndB with AHSA1/START domain
MNNTKQAGEVTITGNRATIRFTRLLAHSPKTVWGAITTPAEFNAWYNAKATIDVRVGGLFEVLSGPFHWSGKILDWQPFNRFSYEHNHEPCPEMPGGEHTVVTWELAPSNKGTLLTFTQTNLTSVAGFAPGTHVVLDRLNARLDGQPLPDFNNRYNEVEPLYPVWSADNLKDKAE